MSSTLFNRSFDHRETPLSQLDRPLSASERDGSLARELGLRSIRQAQPPRNIVLPSWHVAFVHPPLPSKMAPKPSARRAAPASPLPPLSAA